MEQLNYVHLRGLVGMARSQMFNDRKNVNFTMVTNYAYKDREGTPNIDSTWHNVVAWEGRNVRDIERVQKGARVEVEGRLRTRTYAAADGTEHYVTEIIANKLIVLDENEQLSYEML